MTFRGRLLASTVLLSVSALASMPARAGLLNSTSTIDTVYYAGSTSIAENENDETFHTLNPVSLASSVAYVQGPDDGSSIVVNDISITITNLLAFTFCSNGSSVGSACTDAIDGFQFNFTNESLVGATVDGSTSAGFTPATFASHQGLDVVNGDELLVDLTGADPAVDGTLTIDLSFVAAPPPPPPPTAAPEPASVTLFGAALGGLVATRRRRAKRT